VVGTNLHAETDWLVFADGEALADAVAEHIQQALNKAVNARGEFHLVLPGGTSPHKLLLRLREHKLPWKAIHLYLTDERCLPSGHKQRNDHMLDKLLLPYITLPDSNVHRIPAELGPEKGAHKYVQMLRDAPWFDLVILGLGEDGHTASLFPTSQQLDEVTPAVAVFNAPKPPPARVSLGLPRILSARERIVMATGEGKRGIIELIREGKEFPITHAKPSVWYLDKAAANYSKS
jgi:6-phosphogluconolactonase